MHSSLLASLQYFQVLQPSSFCFFNSISSIGLVRFVFANTLFCSAHSAVEMQRSVFSSSSLNLCEVLQNWAERWVVFPASPQRWGLRLWLDQTQQHPRCCFPEVCWTVTVKHRHSLAHPPQLLPELCCSWAEFVGEPQRVSVWIPKACLLAFLFEETCCTVWCVLSPWFAQAVP